SEQEDWAAAAVTGGLLAVTRKVGSQGPLHHIRQPKLRRVTSLKPSFVRCPEYRRVDHRSRPPLFHSTSRSYRLTVQPGNAFFSSLTAASDNLMLARPSVCKLRPQNSRRREETCPYPEREKTPNPFMILLDTDHLSVFTDERDPRHELLHRRMEAAAEQVAC